MMRPGHGDDDAGRVLAELYREHAAAVFAYAFHLVGSRQDAEDVVQTAFLHAHRMLARGERIVTPRAWLTTVVKRRVFNQWRDRREVPVAEPPDFVARIGADDAVEELRRVRLVLFSLPESQHQAFVLRYWSGLSNREIADVLETSESAVESLLVRARVAILAAGPAGGECDQLRDRLADARSLSGDQMHHVERCGSCRRARQRLTRVAAAAVVATLLPRVHVAQALAATVPGFAVGGAAGGAGAASGAGIAAKAAGMKTAVAVLLSAATVTAAVPVAVHAVQRHTQAHGPVQGAAARATEATPVSRFGSVRREPLALRPLASRPVRVRLAVDTHKPPTVGVAATDGDQQQSTSEGGQSGDTAGDVESQSNDPIAGTTAGDQGGDQGTGSDTGDGAADARSSQGDPTAQSGDAQ